MKRSIVVALTLSVLAASAHAANSQQSKMTDCNAQAKTQSLAGDARKAFMKSCLSGDTAPVAQTQQSKMKTCNADAGTKQLKGDERKAFMKSCLSNK